MSAEDRLMNIITAHCPRACFGVAPEGTGIPHVTVHHIGGRSLRFFDNTAPSLRNSAVQINVWAETQRQAFSLLQDIADDLMQTRADLLVRSTDQPRVAPDKTMCGAMQDFSAWADR